MGIVVCCSPPIQHARRQHIPKRSSRSPFLSLFCLEGDGSTCGLSTSICVVAEVGYGTPSILVVLSKWEEQSGSQVIKRRRSQRESIGQENPRQAQ